MNTMNKSPFLALDNVEGRRANEKKMKTRDDKEKEQKQRRRYRGRKRIFKIITKKYRGTCSLRSFFVIILNRRGKSDATSSSSLILSLILMSFDDFCPQNSHNRHSKITQDRRTDGRMDRWTDGTTGEWKDTTSYRDAQSKLKMKSRG